MLKPKARLEGHRWTWGGSVRTQLVAWNSIALLLLLSIMGLVVRYSVKALMTRSISNELAHRVHMLEGPGPPPPHQDFGPPPGAFAGGDPNAPPHGMGPGPEREGQGPGFPGEGPMPPQEGPMGPHHGPGGHPPPHDDGPYPALAFTLDGKALMKRLRQTPWDATAFDAVRQKVAGGTALGAATRAFSSVDIDGAPFELLTEAGRGPQGQTIIIQAPYPLTDVNLAVAELDRTLLALIPVALLCSALGGMFLTGRVLQRVSRMTLAAGRIGAQDLSERLPVSGKDEFSELALTFNGMLGRLETAFKRQEKILEQQRRFTADASHELKTPLTVIKGNTSLALGVHPTAEEYHQSMQEIDQAASSMSRLVQDLLLLARSDSGQLTGDRIDLLVREILERAISAVKPLGGAPIHLQIDDESLCVHGDEAELTRVFTNLLDNAIRYTPVGGAITVSARRKGDFAVLCVADTGVGIAPEHLPHLGERFYRIDTSRTRPSGGTGLGLSICKGIVESHRGTLVFESEAGVGTRVWVTLPCVES